MLDAVINVCQSYYDNIPSNALSTIGKSAAYSFFISFAFLPKVAGEPMDMARPIAAAGYAALVSLIHALTTPIFNGIFGDN